MIAQRPLTSLVLALLAAVLLFSGPASAQSAQLPNKMQILVGVAAGGPNDAIARMMAERLREKFGITAVVVNQTGANGMIAANTLLQSAPDGQNIIILSQGLITISPHLSKMTFDPLTDFTPIAGLATTDVGFCVGSNVPASNMKEFVAYAKGRSTPVTFGSAGVGNITHLLLEKLKQVTGVPFVHVPYRGIGPSLQDVAGGHIEGSVCALVVAMPLVRSGKVKIIGLFGSKRSKLVPDVPTTGEQGYPIPEDSWYGIFGPPKMSPQLAMKLFEAFKEVVTDEGTARDLAKVGFDPWLQNPGQIAKIMRDESALWGKLIRDNNIKAE